MIEFLVLILGLRYSIRYVTEAWFQLAGPKPLPLDDSRVLTGFEDNLSHLISSKSDQLPSDDDDADADVNIQHESKISFFRRKVSKLFFLPKKSQRNQFITFFLSTNLPLEDNLVALSGVEKPRCWN